MDRNLRCRKLCEQIESHYLHREKFKLSAAIKYLEICDEWIGNMDVFDFQVPKYAFNLLIVPLPSHMNALLEKKKDQELDLFFTKALEFFAHSHARCTTEAETAVQMIIDVHKLRLVSFPESEDYFTEAREYLELITSTNPQNGAFWFHRAVIELTIRKSTICKFSQLLPFIRSLVAINSRPSSQNVLMLIKKLNLDFKNNLLGFVMKDLEGLLNDNNTHWSFLKYFDRFICSSHVTFEAKELVCLLLLVFGLCLLRRNDQSLEAFISLILNSSNLHVNRLWPACLLLALLFIKQQSCQMSDQFWVKCLQLLKAESCSAFSCSSATFLDCFTGSVLSDSQNFKSFSEYDFQEDLSIEHDAIIQNIAEIFNHSPFNQFIQKDGDSFRLGPHFGIEKDTDPPTSPKVNKPTINLDDSIQDLQERLKTLKSLESQPVTPSIDLQKSTIIVDTNALISNDLVLQDELISNPSRFVIPLIVLAEIEKVKENSDRERLASSALDIINPLVQSEKLSVVNNFGRILRPLEIKQQCEALILTLSLDKRINDDVILDLCPTFKHQNALLLTDDINMRLKAKTRDIESISLRDFHRLCNR